MHIISSGPSAESVPTATIDWIYSSFSYYSQDRQDRNKNPRKQDTWNLCLSIASEFGVYTTPGNMKGDILEF